MRRRRAVLHVKALEAPRPRPRPRRATPTAVRLLPDCVLYYHANDAIAMLAAWGQLIVVFIVLQSNLKLAYTCFTSPPTVAAPIQAAFYLSMAR